MKLTIAHKLSLSSVFLVLVTAGVVGAVFHTKTINIMVDNTFKRIALDVQEAGNTLQNIINTHDENVLFLASTPPVQGIIRARFGNGIDKKDLTSYPQWVSRLQTIFVSLLKRKEKYQIIRFIDHDGQELVSVRRDSSGIVRVKKEALQNKSHRPYVHETLKLPLGKIYLSEINLNREYGKIVVPHQEVFRVATPVYDERNGESAGLVIVTFKIGDELREIQERASKNRDSVIYITNDHGGYLLHPNKEMTYGFDLEKRYRIQEDIPQLSELYLPNNSSKYKTLMPEDTTGRDVVNFTKIPFDINDPERFIAVVMTQNYEKIVEEESALLNEIAFLAMLISLAGVVLAVIFSIRITKPIKDMTEAVNEFSQTHSLTTTLSVDSNDEMGVLARSFNGMIDQVRQSRKELEDMNNQLELKVAVRTQALNKALEEAERASKAKSEFLSRMSHELRTPMNAILGFGQMLELDRADFNEVQRINVKEILEAGYHLLDLINEVLDLAKIESGNLTLSIDKVSIDKVIQQSLSLIQKLADSRKIELIDNVSDKGYFVEADAMRLKQVMLNLLSNAVKYNNDNGKVILDCKLIQGDRLRIYVKDSGDGIDENDINKLFTAFERLDKKSNIEGAGIGLVITKYLVELMDGEIGVESVASEGSTFWIEIPFSH